MSAPKRRILIDTDTASDDAVALIMALRSPAVQVEAITVVAGNVPVDQGCRNALFTVELCGAIVPVFRGAEAPLARELQIADWFHGRDGLGDHGYAPSTKSIETEPASDAILRVVNSNPGIEIITLGPLTNLAIALAKKPTLASNVSRCVVMGGAPCCEGNVTPAAEYNIWVDPEAARAVLRSDLPVELVGWQLCRGAAVISPAELEHLNRFASGLADFAVRANSTALEANFRQTREPGITLPDPVAMGILIDRSLCLHVTEHLVEVETTSDLTRGMTVVDRLDVTTDSRNRDTWSDALAHGRKTKICWQLDAARWKALLFDSLR